MRPLRTTVFWLLFWYLSCAFQVAAERVMVRAGEHGTFTRVVVPFGTPTAWQLGRVPTGYALVPGSGVAAEYDLGTVFERIGRQRIADMRRDGNRLVLQVSCDCHATATAYRDSWVVIDVRDGPAPAGSPFERSPEVTEHRATVSGQRPSWMGTLALGGLDPLPAARPADLVAGPGPAHHATTDGMVFPEEAALRKEMARAVAQGLLSPALDPLPQIPTNVSSPAAAPAEIRSHETAEHIRFIAETAVDRDSGDTRSGLAVSDDGRSCEADAALDLEAWGGDDPVAAELGRLRRELAGELDQPDPAAVHALARYLVRIGFGAEAVQTLALLPDGADPVVLALAHLVDEGAHDGPEVLKFSGQETCPGRAAFWSVLAAGRREVTARAERRAVLSAFSELPLDLRRHLAPRVANLFLAIGDTSSAGAVRNAVARAPGDHGAGLDLIEAGIERSTGNPFAAADRLLRTFPASGPAAPEVMIDLLQADVESGRGRASLSRQAEAMAFELEGTPEGRDLERLAVDAAITGGDLIGAAALLRSRPTLDHAEGLWLKLVDRSARVEDDVAFLQQHFALREDLDRLDLPEGVRLVLARRLIALGFVEAGLDVVPPAPTSAEARIALAAGLVALGRGEEALGALAGLAGPEAEALRHRADMIARASPQVPETRAPPEEQGADPPEEGGRGSAGQQSSPASQVLPVSGPDLATEADGLDLARAALSSAAEVRSRIADILQTEGRQMP